MGYKPQSMSVMSKTAHTHKEAFFPKASDDAADSAEHARNEPMKVKAVLQNWRVVEYEVTDESGDTHTTTPEECSCDDTAGECKHQRRVRLATEYADLAAFGERLPPEDPAENDAVSRYEYRAVVEDGEEVAGFRYAQTAAEVRDDVISEKAEEYGINRSGVDVTVFSAE